MITNADITIFNARYQAKSRSEAYIPTMIKHVSLWESEASNANSGIWSDRSVYKFRIPYSGSEVSENKGYMPEQQYRALNEPDNFWSLRKGDYIVTALYDGEKKLLSKAELDAWAKEHGVKLIAVTEYADNTIRGSDAVKHWRIGGA